MRRSGNGSRRMPTDAPSVRRCLSITPGGRGAPPRSGEGWQRKKFEGAQAAITWPVEYGGRGGTPIQQMIWNEEQAAFDVPAGLVTASLGMIGPADAVRDRGTESVSAGDAPGDEVWCRLFSEPEAGSDLAAVRLVVRSTVTSS